MCLITEEDRNGVVVREERGESVFLPRSPSSNSNHKATELSMPTIQELAKNNVVIVIHDKVYNVSSFLDQHPGGDLVLRNMSGKDCTDAFENYHQAHVTKYLLKRFLIGRVADEPPVPPHVQAFRDVREELIRRGMFKVEKHFYAKLYVWLMGLFVAALYLSLACEGSTSCHMLGAVIMGLFWQQLAGLGHDLGHTNVSRDFQQDHWFASLLPCCLSGLSMSWWKRNHNIHHVVVNSVENDPDIQHMPMFAVSKAVIEKPFWSSYYKKMIHMDSVAKVLVGYQHILFLPIMFFARFNLYAQSWIFLADRNMKTDYRYLEMFSVVVFLAWFGAVATSFSSWTEAVAWVLLAHGVAGFLHLQIVVSHWAMATYNGHAYNDESDEWYRLQLKTSLNIDCPPWMDWAHFGLQYQIEHHLFPTLPRTSLRYASILVREACLRHGIEYHSISFTEAVSRTLQALSATAAQARKGQQVPNFLMDTLNLQG